VAPSDNAIIRLRVETDAMVAALAERMDE